MSIKQHPLYRKWTHIQSVLKSERYRIANRTSIEACECDWTTFKDFADDIDYFLGEPPVKHMVLHRKDTTKGWVLKNLEWADRQRVAKTQRTAIRLKYKGQTKCLKEWCEEFQVSIWTARRRYHKGKRFKEIFA